ncbi:MAG TPA: PqqD family peptide modification chaperone [Burkholderiales bacterium]|jgi:multidrug resistance efflux pump|nr:PqqD family peptide modification chaperone [Burkholderiales bacterium]
MEDALAAVAASPKFRSDLEVSEQRAGAATVYVLKEPSSGRIFRLPEVAYFIARQLDGRSAPEDIRRKVEEKFGDALSQEELDAYTTQLRRLGLLEGATQAPAAQAAAARVRGDLLYLRFKAFDPDRGLELLLPVLRWVYTRGFVACSGALILFALAVAAANWQEIRQEFARLYSFHALAYAWFVLILTVCAHEIAHGLTCKRFGGQVREMGFMLIYFQPALYCNVSDAWMFPEKAKRLWVTAAGAWLDILLWALAVLAWRVTEPDAALHFAALVVLATAGVRTLFNVNPLIKLDGYYLLSDALDVPNLRARAFKYLGSLRRRLMGEIGATPDDTPARERRIFLAYGVLAGAYSMLLLGSIAWWFGGYLVGEYHGFGFVLFVVLMSMILRNPLKRSLLALPERIRSAPVWFRSMRRPVKVLTVSGAVLGALFLVPMTLTVSGGFAIRPVDNADMRAEVEGIIETVYVNEGDMVEKDALVAQLADYTRRAELAQTDAALQEKQARLKMLRAGPRPEDIALARQRVVNAKTREIEAVGRHSEAGKLRAERIAGARAAVERAREQLAFAEQSAARVRPLVQQGFYSAAKFDEAETEIFVRRRALEEAQASLRHARADELREWSENQALAKAARTEAERELERLAAGARPEEIEAMEAEVASLEARQRLLQDQIERLLIRSPHAGVITTPRLKEKIGQYVSKGDLIAEVHDLRQLTVEIEVPERDIGPVRVGQPVYLKARAYPGETFRGVVTGIAPAMRESDPVAPVKTVRVATVIDNAEQKLKTRMTGYAKIDCGTRPLIEVLTHGVVGALRVEVWSWW